MAYWGEVLVGSAVRVNWHESAPPWMTWSDYFRVVGLAGMWICLEGPGAEGEGLGLRGRVWVAQAYIECLRVLDG